MKIRLHFASRDFCEMLNCVKNRDPTIPLVAVCDFSWVIMKSLLTCFNEESLNEYVERCHVIVTGMAKEDELSITRHLLVLHMCLAHIMKFVSFQVRKESRKTRKRVYPLLY